MFTSRRARQTAAPIAVAGALALAFGPAPAAFAEDSEPAQKRTPDPRTGATTPSGAVDAQPRPREEPQGVASGASGSSPTYTVREGDTITGIAIRHGLRTVDVLTWNGLGWSSTIFPGQELTLAASSPAPRQEAPASAPSGGGGYTVRAGDTLWSIAQAHDTTVSALSAANDLGAAAVIFPGQKLTLPGGEGSGSSAPPAAPAPAPERKSPTTHTVEAGDTLWSIAAGAGIDVDDLLALNDIDASSIIYPGQKLVVAKPTEKKEAPDVPTSIYDSPVHDLQAQLNAPQAENARLIIGIGRELGVSDTGIAIALATSMVESGLRNLDHGDRDSLGLFQQRPSAGWGSKEQIVDRGHATRAFFGGAGDPNGNDTRGLLDIDGWESMDFGDAAQAVQVSAFPDRYDRWRVAAYGWLAHHG